MINLQDLLVGRFANPFLLALELDEELAVQPRPGGGVWVAVRQRVRADPAIDGGLLDLDLIALLLLRHVFLEMQEKIALLRLFMSGGLARCLDLLGVYRLPHRASRGVAVAEVDREHSQAGEPGEDEPGVPFPILVCISMRPVLRVDSELEPFGKFAPRTLRLQLCREGHQPTDAVHHTGHPALTFLVG